jgi:hypothetical protein
MKKQMLLMSLLSLVATSAFAAQWNCTTQGGRNVLVSENNGQYDLKIDGEAVAARVSVTRGSGTFLTVPNYVNGKDLTVKVSSIREPRESVRVGDYGVEEKMECKFTGNNVPTRPSF